MKITETLLRDAYVVELDKIEDERGFFARSWCVDEFREHGLNPNLVQCNVSFNEKKATLRGMHYQAFPHEEAKLVRCTRGSLYDVIIDLRCGSPTFKQWSGFELTASNRKAIYIPEGFAHGFQTLEDDTEIFYQISTFYDPPSARGLRYDDAEFEIEWPLEASHITSRDMSFDSFMKGFEPESVGRSIRNVVFWGATGQAKVLKECTDRMGLKLLALFDNDTSASSPFEGVPLFYKKAGLNGWLSQRDAGDMVGFFAAIGGDKGRERLELQEHAATLGLEPLVATHPRACISEDVTIGAGSQILANSAVCVGSSLGRACIVNTGANVDHECHIGEGVHIGPGAVLAGCVEIEDFATIYSGAIVLPRVKIGKNAVIGAGAVVRHNVPDNTVVAGNPAMKLKGV